MLTQKNHPLKKTSRIAFVIVLLPLIIPLAVAGLIFFFFYRIILYLLIWLVWLPRGKDVLYVSSDSPIWRDYMAEQILPLVDNRAVILNWSEREKWRYGSFSPRIFRAFGGSREFNPLVVVFPPSARQMLPVPEAIQGLEGRRSGARRAIASGLGFVSESVTALMK